MRTCLICNSRFEPLSWREKLCSPACVRVRELERERLRYAQMNPQQQRARVKRKRAWRVSNPGIRRELNKKWHAAHPLYATWSNMIQRCTNPRNARFFDYGGRGISVCGRWLTFQNFEADMGVRPTPAHSLDRVNNDGNYQPDNCEWATKSKQRLNSRIRAARMRDRAGRFVP
jgi:hypothetical protein